MEELMVRDAIPEDIEGITRVAEQGWTTAYRDVLADATIEAALAEWYDPALTRERIEDDDVTYLVAAQADTVVGYASGAAHDSTVVGLGSIYVTPDRWGDGIGTALLTEFERRWSTRGYDVVQLYVLADNDVGQSFYRSQGYEAVEEREADLFGEIVTDRRYRKKLG
ncbi:GNAT family N-acetyltransferase [Natranaeroarchaeum aerophilus]|uniref:GNAT family N-acetyltransferase n=1 Tax=Natranaeroarchaeum aerophilus TaxID=2917711 RepID=A0AAE3K7Z6_9EURY|nr:GNAT family N-acetyltransferase [Natranaeroarchaeum aerophilus]MCL9814469.1 GNAT family N-acetyltransferase [Natranaeroarchaeum aerophilus]